MYKLPKFFEQELFRVTKLTKADKSSLKERGVDPEYFDKLEKAWRTGKKSKDENV
jgi:hypothetical protein